MTRELVHSTVQVARAVFGARAASLLLHDTVAGELEFVAVSGEGADPVAGLRISADAGIAGWVLKARQPLVLEDVARDPRYAVEVASMSGYQPQGLMAAPLLAGDDAIGVLEVLDRPQRAHFSLIELDLLGLLAPVGRGVGPGADFKPWRRAPGGRRASAGSRGRRPSGSGGRGSWPASALDGAGRPL